MIMAAWTAVVKLLGSELEVLLFTGKLSFCNEFIVNVAKILLDFCFFDTNVL